MRIVIASVALLFATLATATRAQTLYISSFADEVVAVDPISFAVIGTAFSGPELTSPSALAEGPGGDIYVVGTAAGGGSQVLRYDPDTQAFLGVVVSIPDLSNNPISHLGPEMAFGPSGDLYVGGRYGSPASAELRRYDSGTGALVSSLAGVSAAFAFGPDDHLYTADEFSDDVIERDPDTYASLGLFATGSINDPSSYASHLAFATDGTFYILSQGHTGTEAILEIAHYDTDGAFLNESGWEQNCCNYFDLEYNPHRGEASAASDLSSVVTWDGITRPDLAPGGVLTFNSVSPEFAWRLLFVPEPGPGSALVAGAALLLLLRARRQRGTRASSSARSAAADGSPGRAASRARA